MPVQLVEDPIFPPRDEKGDQRECEDELDLCVFDLVHHVISHKIYLVIVCGARFSLSSYVSHLSLSVVEEVFMQLSVCQSNDNTGRAITCRHHSSQTNHCSYITGIWY